MKHTDDALAPYDNAVTQSDDALDPDDPPAGRLFIKLRMDRCLTSGRKGYVGVKWRNSKRKSQTALLLAHYLQLDKWKKWNLNSCRTARCTCCSLHVQIYTVRSDSLTHMHSHTFTHVTYGLTFGMWPSEGSAWKECCAFDFYPPQTHQSSAAACCGHDL